LDTIASETHLNIYLYLHLPPFPDSKINKVHCVMTLHTIHIVGAGISGLTLAKCLQQKGVKAIVFDKNPSAARHNYGISLQPWACQALLKVLGIDVSTFCRRVAVDALNGGHGQVHSEMSSGVAGSKQGPPALRTHRGRLESLLRESLEVKWGYALQDISTKGPEHTLHFKDEEEIQSRFLVDASGVHSQIRKSVSPKSELNILPYVVFRGTRHLDEQEFKKTYSRYFKDGNIAQTKEGDVVLQITINDFKEDSKGVNISYIYSRPSRSNDYLHRPGRELGESTKISDLFYEEVSKLEGLEQPFKEASNGEKMKRDRVLHWLMRDILLPLDEVIALAKKGIMLLGDSAHALPILGGEGANVAIMDAVKLAEYFKSEDSELIEEFYRQSYTGWESKVKEGEQRLAEMHSRSKNSVL